MGWIEVARRVLGRSSCHAAASMLCQVPAVYSWCCQHQCITHSQLTALQQTDMALHTDRTRQAAL
jgi:hypothetical protein